MRKSISLDSFSSSSRTMPATRMREMKGRRAPSPADSRSSGETTTAPKEEENGSPRSVVFAGWKKKSRRRPPPPSTAYLVRHAACRADAGCPVVAERDSTKASRRGLDVQGPSSAVAHVDCQSLDPLYGGLDDSECSPLKCKHPRQRIRMTEKRSNPR